MRIKIIATAILWVFLGVFELGAQVISTDSLRVIPPTSPEPYLQIDHNSEAFIPLKRLDTLRVAAAAFNRYPNQQLINRLNAYQPVAAISLDDSSPIADQLGGSNLIVLELDVEEKVNPDLMEHMQSEQVSGLLIHTKDSLSAELSDTFKAIIHISTSDSVHHDLAAQMVYGGIGDEPIIAIGDSIAYPKGVRLAYVQPEAIGVSSSELAARIDSIVNLGLDSAAYPGCQVLVAKDQKVFFHKAYGYHTHDRERAVQLDDIYDLASVTKVTAALAALMKLHDDGMFELDATLGDYWEKTGANKKGLTFRQILAHQSGLKAWIPYHTTTRKKNGQFKRNTLAYGPSEAYNIRLTDSLYLHKDYKRKIYKMIRKSPVDPAQGYVYSGLTFYLYPEMVEQKTNVDYEEYLKNSFYHPLGATTLTYNPLRFYELDRIVPTEVDTFFRHEPLHGVVHDEGAAMMNGVSGNAGLFGSATDLAKMWQMYLNMGTYGGERYLTNQTLRKFSTCAFCEDGNRRGLGFDKPLVIYHPEQSSVAPQAGPESFGHSGYTGTFVWADPEHGLLYIFLSNRVYPTRNNRKLYELNIRPSIHKAIYDALGITWSDGH